VLLVRRVYYGIIHADINVNAIGYTLESTARTHCPKRVHLIGGDIPFVVRVIAIPAKDMTETVIKLQENVVANKTIFNRLTVMSVSIVTVIQLAPILIVAILFLANADAVPVLSEDVVIRVRVLSQRSHSEDVKSYMKVVRDLSVKIFGGRERFSGRMLFSRVRLGLLARL